MRRYDHHLGALLHVTEELGNIPEGGGLSSMWTVPRCRHRAVTVRGSARPRRISREPLLGTCFVHTVMDDQSRVTYAEIHAEQIPAAVGSCTLQCRGSPTTVVSMEGVLSENGSAWKSHA